MICGEDGHFTVNCEVLFAMVNDGTVHMKNGDNDKRIYLGRTGDTLVHRAGYRTLRNAAIA